MKTQLTIEGDELAKLSINSIHLANAVRLKLQARGVPMLDQILPMLDPAQATGKITWERATPTKITVNVEWASTEDDDL